MAPHLIVLATAFTVSAVAQLILQGKTPLIVAGAALLTICGLFLLLGEPPSLIGLALAALLSATGAIVGVLVVIAFRRATSASL